MADLLCTLMGILDIVVGFILFFTLPNSIGVILGVLMILKGGMSLF